jgi:hypothetical protein
VAAGRSTTEIEVLCEPLFCAVCDQFTNITVPVQVAVCYDQTAWNKHKIKQITVFVELVYFENEEPV